MGRLAAVVCASIVLSGCTAGGFRAASNPFPPREGVPELEAPPGQEIASSGFVVELDSIVMLWARDADVDVARVIKRSLVRVDRELQSPPARIDVQGGSHHAIPDVGISGFTDPDTGVIRIAMDARSQLPLDEMLTVWLPFVISHELHHSKRIIDGPGYGHTLLEALITEGAAEAFARSIFPDAPPIPWVAPLSKKEEVDVWRRAQTSFNATDEIELHEKWFFGGDGLPRWAGYRLGYAIVRAYLDRHPDVTAAELATVPATEVLGASGYAPAG